MKRQVSDIKTLLSKIFWWCFNVLGLRAVWYKIKPPDRKVPSTFIVLFITIWTSLYWIASNQYYLEKYLLDTSANIIITNSANYPELLFDIPEVQNESLPCSPDFMNPVSFFTDTVSPYKEIMKTVFLKNYMVLQKNIKDDYFKSIDRDFERLDMSDVEIARLGIDDLVFIASNFSKCTFHDSEFSFTLRNCDFTENRFLNCTVSDTRIRSNLHPCDKYRQTDFSNSSFYNFSASGVSVRSEESLKTSFKNTEFKSASFKNIVIQNVDFSASTFSDVKAVDINPPGNKTGKPDDNASLLNFRNCKFENSAIRNSRLIRSDFRGAHFNDVTFNNVDISFSDFRDIKNSGKIKFTNTTVLYGCDFSGADLSNADFSGALVRADGRKRPSFKGAVFSNTRWTDGRILNDIPKDFR